MWILGLLLISDYTKEEEFNVEAERDPLVQGSTVILNEMNLFQEDQENKVEKEVSILHILFTSNFLWLYLIAITHLFYGYYMSNSFK